MQLTTNSLDLEKKEGTRDLKMKDLLIFLIKVMEKLR